MLNKIQLFTNIIKKTEIIQDYCKSGYHKLLWQRIRRSGYQMKEDWNPTANEQGQLPTTSMLIGLRSPLIASFVPQKLQEKEEEYCLTYIQFSITHQLTHTTFTMDIVAKQEYLLFVLFYFKNSNDSSKTEIWFLYLGLHVYIFLLYLYFKFAGNLNNKYFSYFTN